MCVYACCVCLDSWSFTYVITNKGVHVTPRHRTHVRKAGHLASPAGHNHPESPSSDRFSSTSTLDSPPVNVSNEPHLTLRFLHHYWPRRPITPPIPHTRQHPLVLPLDNLRMHMDVHPSQHLAMRDALGQDPLSSFPVYPRRLYARDNGGLVRHAMVYRT